MFLFLLVALQLSASAQVGVSTTSAVVEAQDARAHLRRAKALLESGSYRAAADEAGKALELGYERASPYNLRSQAYIGEGRFEEALADAERAVLLHPSGAAAYLNRAAAKEGLKFPAQEVLTDYKKASALDARLMPRTAAAMARHAGGRESSAQGVSPQAPRSRSRRVWGAAALSGLGGLAYLIAFQWRRRRDKVLRLGYALGPAGELAEPGLGAVVEGLYILEKVIERQGDAVIYEARDLADQPKFLLRRPRPEGGYAYLAFEGEEHARAGLRQMQ